MPETLREPAGPPAWDASALQEAFARFQRHCRQLEAVHDDLRAQLNRRVQEIERIKEQLADILESITDAVLLVDGGGSVEVANGAARRLLGNVDAPHAVPGLDRLLAAETLLRDEQMTLPLPGGTRTVLATAVPKAGHGGRPGARVIAIKDVTEQHALQERLRHAQRMAELGHMAAGVAHQIRNPLTGMEGFARLLERDLQLSDPHAAHMAARIVQAARRVGDVITNMMYYVDQPPQRTAPCDLADVAQAAIDVLRPWAADVGVRIELHRPDTSVLAAFDPHQMQLAAANLLANALEACRGESDGLIEVAVSADEAWVRLHIRDTGVGIPADALPRVREPFFSLQEHGLGLGLSIADRLTSAHGGRLDIAPRPRGGTAVTLELPRQRRRS